MKSEQDKIAALEKALADAHLKLRVSDELIQPANLLYSRSGGCPTHARRRHGKLHTKCRSGWCMKGRTSG